MDKHDVDLEMRFKIEQVFEHYAAKSEYYRRANIAQRFQMEDAFYRLTMESSRHAPPGSPPSPAAISIRLFGLTHFNSARG